MIRHLALFLLLGSTVSVADSDPAPFAGFYGISPPNLTRASFATYAIPLVAEPYCRQYLADCLNPAKKGACLAEVESRWKTLGPSAPLSAEDETDRPESFQHCPQNYLPNPEGQCYRSVPPGVRDNPELHYQCPAADQPVPMPKHNALACFRTERRSDRIRKEEEGERLPYFWLRESGPTEIFVPRTQWQRALAYVDRKLLSQFGFHREREPSLSPAAFCERLAASDQAAIAYYRSTLSGPRAEPLPITLARLADNPLLFHSGLDEVGANAIVNYMSTYFEKVNPALWSGKITPELKIYIEKTTEALSRLPVYRGQSLRITTLPEAVLAQHQTGTIVTYGAFTSSSRNLRLDWEGRHRFFLYSGRSGRYVSPVRYGKEYHTEDEVLFPPGTRFKVLSRTERSGGRIDFVLAEVDEKDDVVHAPAPRVQVPLIFSPF